MALAPPAASWSPALQSNGSADVVVGVESRNYDHGPGSGYIWAQGDDCPDSWAEDLDGDGTTQDQDATSCIHADFASSEFQVPDEEEPYTSDYDAELGSNPKYCSDGVKRIMAVYAVTPDHQSRYDELLPKLRRKAERADYWLYKSARSTGGNRHFRFKCTNNNEIFVNYVTLPKGSDASFGDTIRELRETGLDSNDRKYLVYADYTEDGNGNICGRGEIKNDDSPGETNDNNGGNMYAVVYLKGCDSWAGTTLHELGHTLGGTQQSAPRHDPQNSWHPRDEHDVLAYGANTYEACGDSTKNHRYDCDDNDYFDTSPVTNSYLVTHWNTARNKFLVK